jgi:hypothetical protein
MPEGQQFVERRECALTSQQYHKEIETIRESQIRIEENVNHIVKEIREHKQEARGRNGAIRDLEKDVSGIQASQRTLKWIVGFGIPVVMVLLAAANTIMRYVGTTAPPPQ